MGEIWVGIVTLMAGTWRWKMKRPLCQISQLSCGGCSVVLPRRESLLTEIDRYLCVVLCRGHERKKEHFPFHLNGDYLLHTNSQMCACLPVNRTPVTFITAYKCCYPDYNEYHSHKLFLIFYVVCTVQFTGSLNQPANAQDAIPHRTCHIQHTNPQIDHSAYMHGQKTSFLTL
jgi:hypothetical protein